MINVKNKFSRHEVLFCPTSLFCSVNDLMSRCDYFYINNITRKLFGSNVTTTKASRYYHDKSYRIIIEYVRVVVNYPIIYETREISPGSSDFPTFQRIIIIIIIVIKIVNNSYCRISELS